MKTIRRRRREGKTDYKARMNMLKSESVRLVVRKSNRYITAQFVSSELAQDKTLVGVSSSMLLDKGWPEDASGSLKSKAAAYLTGLMLGKLAKSKVKSAILDFGLNRNVAGSRIYAVLKGVVEEGIKIPHKAEMLPSEASLSSDEKIKSLINKLKAKL